MQVNCPAVLLGMLLCAVSGCGQQAEWIECATRNQNPLVTIHFNQQMDVFQGDVQARRYRVRITNNTGSSLSDVRLHINGTWAADLGQLLIHKGIWQGTSMPEDDSLRARETIEVILSHDVSNHAKFTNSMGETMPARTRFRKLRVDYAGGSDAFTFPEVSGSPRKRRLKSAESRE